MPNITIIAAMTEQDHIIGKEGWLPWDIQEELGHFLQTTKDGTVIMGRKTFESIGRPMAGRHNIVVSRQRLSIPDADVCHSVAEAITLANNDGKEIFIIGGTEVYQEGIPFSDTMILSFIKKRYDGDTYFPDWDEKEWIIDHTEDHGEWVLKILKR